MTIKVTWKHINDAMRLAKRDVFKPSWMCPVALALREGGFPLRSPWHFMDDRNHRPFAYGVQESECFDENGDFYDLPENAQKAVNDFDHERYSELQPIEFEVDYD